MLWEGAPEVYLAKVTAAIHYWQEDDYFRYLAKVTAAVHTCLAASDDEAKRPAPQCEQLSDIAARLKEIEAERLRAIQAATLPGEKN
jgi:hypothetical protein